MANVHPLSINQINEDNTMKSRGFFVNQAYSYDLNPSDKQPMPEEPTKDQGDGYSTISKDNPISAKQDETEGRVGEFIAVGKPYAGMGKDELLLHSCKPLWKNMRRVCIALVLLTWLALIAAVIALIVVHPRCKAPLSVKWWQKGVFYRIFVRSFQDSDDDGIGDLQGITSRLDYLEELGVNALMLSSIYAYEPPSDLSITNHKAIHRDYGTMEEFESLINATHEKGLYLILDFVPNHTGVTHPWFVASSASDSLDNPHRNYYVWAERQNARTPRNNWKSVYDGSAWTKAVNRSQDYMHQFLQTEPDLNLRNTDVQQELEDILKFWLNKGVDGFYIRHSAYMFEDYNLEDEELKEGNDMDLDAYDSYNHTRTYALPEVGDMFARWRWLLTTHGNGDPNQLRERFLTADIDVSHADTMQYYGYFGRGGVSFPLNSILMVSKGGVTAAEVRQKIDFWMNGMPDQGSPNWMLGDENIGRLLNRTSDSEARLLLMAAFMLPGAPILYYGDELGLYDASLTPEPSVWEIKGKMRSPMLWDNSSFAGFMPGDNCTNQPCAPWMRVPDGETATVQEQNANPNSILSLVKNLTSLRSDGTLQYGSFRYINSNDNVVAFLREFDGNLNYLTLLNFGDVDVTNNFENEDAVIEIAKVKVTTGNDVVHEIDAEIETNDVKLKAKQGIVLTWAYQIKEYI